MTNQNAHESTDIVPLHAATFAAGLAIFLAIVFIISLSVFHYFTSAYLMAYRPRVVSSLQSLPEPRLQLFPRDDLDQLRHSNQQILETYGWVNRQDKTVRIPIERAMEIIAERGLPDFTSRGSK